MLVNKTTADLIERKFCPSMRENCKSHCSEIILKTSFNILNNILLVNIFFRYRPFHKFKLFNKFDHFNSQSFG